MTDRPPTPPPGLRCPRCGCPDLRVTHTRPAAGRVRRYRRCRHCGRVVSTLETLGPKK